MTRPALPPSLHRASQAAVELDRRVLLTVVTVAGLALAPATVPGRGAPSPVPGAARAAASTPALLPATSAPPTTAMTAASSPGASTGTPTAPVLPRAQLDFAVRGALGEAAASTGVTVVDRRTGARYSLNGDQPFEMASTTKVLILAAFLRARREPGRSLSAGDKARAGAMIRYSDNDAATSLRQAAGDGEGIARTAQDCGMPRTAEWARAQDAWGRVRTTSDEQAALLVLLRDGGRGVIDPADCAYILTLMHEVIPEQAWGAGAVRSTSVAVAVKNGWAQVADGGLWAVNTLGVIQGDGRDYVIAVYEHALQSEARGIEHKNAVVRTVHDALSRPLAAG